MYYVYKLPWFSILNISVAYFIVNYLFYTLSSRWLGFVIGVIIIKPDSFSIRKLSHPERCYKLKIVTDRPFGKDLLNDALV